MKIRLVLLAALLLGTTSLAIADQDGEDFIFKDGDCGEVVPGTGDYRLCRYESRWIAAIPRECTAFWAGRGLCQAGTYYAIDVEELGTPRWLNILAGDNNQPAMGNAVMVLPIRW